jgi:hypothetical protein
MQSLKNLPGKRAMTMHFLSLGGSTAIKAGATVDHFRWNSTTYELSEPECVNYGVWWVMIGWTSDSHTESLQESQSLCLYGAVVGTELVYMSFRPVCVAYNRFLCTIVCKAESTVLKSTAWDCMNQVKTYFHKYCHGGGCSRVDMSAILFCEHPSWDWHGSSEFSG